MTLALLIALCVPPVAVDEYADVLELNSVVNDDGTVICRQLVCWDYEQPEGRYHIRDWKLYQGYIARTPRGYEVLIDDKGTLRRVVAPYAKETIRQYDVELKEREVRGEVNRRRFVK